MAIKYHYCYRITNIFLNKHYYGSRTSSIYPANDIGIKYFSSSSNKEFIKDQKENPQNYKYKIIKTFKTRKQAIDFEIKLHNKFDVAINELFYNKAKQLSTGWDTTGTKHTEETLKKIRNKPHPQSIETRQKISKSSLGKKMSKQAREKMSIAKKGRKMSQEVKDKISNAVRGFKYINVECPHCGKIGGLTGMKSWHFDNCRQRGNA